MRNHNLGWKHSNNNKYKPSTYSIAKKALKYNANIDDLVKSKENVTIR